MFISFEGVNGAGKSTQIEILRNTLKERGYDVIVTREPGGTELAEKIREFIVQNPKMDKITELLLIFASRNEHFQNLIRPKLSESIVLCDRFYDSSLVFQGVLNGVSISDIMVLKEMVLGDFEPDLTLVFDLNYKCATYRMSQRMTTNDKYDRLNEDQFNIIRQAYLKLANLFFNRCVIIPPYRTIEQTANKVLDIVMKRISEGFSTSKNV